MSEQYLRDKSFFFGNEKGQAHAVSVESALSGGMVDFRGWYCALGIENIHISPDGSVFGAACRNSGYLGNVYESMYFLKKDWHRCTRASCSCGADMQIRKVKDPKFIPLCYEDMPKDLVMEMSDPVYTAPVHQFAHRTHPLTLTWDLGRRCNYSCSYCNPAISNKYEAHKTWGSLQFALTGLEKRFLKGRLAKFVFTGGEPTINPAYMDLVKHLRERHHLVHTTTNGSRLPEYFSELIELSFIGLSYHIEFARIEHYVKVLEAIIQKKRENEVARGNWCGVRIMVPPGHLEEALSAREKMLAVEGMREMEIMIFLSPCYEVHEHTKLMAYDQEEFKRIHAFS